jgi:hypothetical protein
MHITLVVYKSSMSTNVRLSLPFKYSPPIKGLCGNPYSLSFRLGFRANQKVQT